MLNSEIIVDDNCIDLIRYIDPPADPFGGLVYNWTHDIHIEYREAIYNASLSSCFQAGCMLLFTFHGTQVTVYGSEKFVVNEVPVWSSYSISGQSNVSHTSGSRTDDTLLFFRSEAMPYGEYTLQINVDHAEYDSPFNLDWIEYNTTNKEGYAHAPDTSGTSSPALSVATTFTASSALVGTSMASPISTSMLFTSTSEGSSLRSATDPLSAQNTAPIMSIQPSSAASPASSVPPTTMPIVSARSSLSQAATTGIAVGATLLGVLALAAFYVKWTQRQKMIPRRMDLDEDEELFSAGPDFQPSSMGPAAWGVGTPMMSEKQRLLHAAPPSDEPSMAR